MRVASAVPVQRRLAPDVRRGQLLDAAERLFVERGYAAVSMSDIAAELGVTRPVANYHFGSKEQVYLACVRRAREEYDGELLTRIDLTAPARDQLAAGADAFFAILERSPDRWSLLFGSTNVLSGEAAAELSRMRFATIDAIAVLIRQAVSGVDERRIQAAAHAASGIGERLGHWWLADPSLSRAELVEHFTEILWAGIGRHAGA